MPRSASLRRAAGPLLALTAALFLTGCELALALLDTSSGGGGGGETPPLNRQFTVYTWPTMTPSSIDAHLVAVSAHCVLYLDDNQVISSTALQEVTAQYEANIYNQMLSNFGSWVDVDGNGKLTILMTDIQDGYVSGGSGGYVAGYFNSGDMYSTVSYADSNEADMITMDVNPGFLPDYREGFYSTIAHEMQHLINFSVNAPKGFVAETWLNEGLSTSAEYVYAGAVDPVRVGYYNNFGNYTIAQGNNFFVWNGFWESEAGGSDVLADYTTAYMFFQWLRLHASNGTGIYREILASGYGDTRAVTSLAASRIDSRFSSWSELMRTWYAANLCNDGTGYYGYKKALDVDGTELAKILYVPGAGETDYPLSPGEGIVTALNLAGGFTPGASGANISYLGITPSVSGSAVDASSPYTGTHSLTLNGNTSVTGSDETGLFPVASLSASVLGTQAPRNLAADASLTGKAPRGEKPEPGPYPIDGMIMPEGDEVSLSGALFLRGSR